MMKRIAFFLALAVGACASEAVPDAPEQHPDPITYCDYCAVDFKGSTCLTSGPDVTDCAMSDGTWWQRSLDPNGFATPVYRRFRVDANGATDLCVCDATTCGATWVR